MAFADRFVLGERVGIGATGEVFRAFDKERGVDVAIKRLHEYLVADPFSRDRFRCETALSARIDSAHVVRCLDGNVDESDRPYLVLEWLEGQDLAAHMKASRLSVDEALEITRQTALGLQAMHDVGVVHRDVKPRNLFVTRALPGKPFVVKLLDLGVAYDAGGERPEGMNVGLGAKAAEGDPKPPMFNLGTPFYMSPEQAQASASIGPASDLFSLGVLFFELLSGRRPFAGPTTYSLLAKIAMQITPRLTDVWPDAPPALEAFVARALARDPESRFLSAREMADELSRLIELNEASGTDSQQEPSPWKANPDHLVAVIFGRLPLPNLGRSRDLFQRIVHEYQGSVVTLLGRGVVGIFHGECADAVLRAADAVLLLAEDIVGARWSLASGPALPPRVGLSEPIIERGTRALERARTGTNEPTVRIDDETASLLEEHYVIEGSAGVHSLRELRNAR